MARHHGHPYNPFALLSPAQQRAQALRYISESLGPVNREFARRNRMGQNAIRDYTNQLAGQLAPLAGQTHANYAEAQRLQGNVDQSLATRLGMLNPTQGAVGAVGVPDLHGMAQGASNAGFATGSAALSQLIGQGASAENYASQLPGIARFSGAHRSKLLAAQLESERAAAADKIRATLPQLENQIANRELQKAIASQSGLIQGQKLQAQIGYQNAKLKQGQQSLNLRAAQQRALEAYRAAGLDLRGKQYDLAVQREAALEAYRAGKGGKGTKAGKTLTPNQLITLRAKGQEFVKNYKNGVINPYYNKNADPNSYHKGIPDTQMYALPPHGGKRNDTGESTPADAMGAFKYLLLHGWPPSMAFNMVGNAYGKWAPPGLLRSMQGKGYKGKH